MTPTKTRQKKPVEAKGGRTARVIPNGFVDSWMVVEENEAGKTIRVLATGLTEAASDRIVAALTKGGAK